MFLFFFDNYITASLVRAITYLVSMEHSLKYFRAAAGPEFEVPLLRSHSFTTGDSVFDDRLRYH